jgi:hypothetical protein
MPQSSGSCVRLFAMMDPSRTISCLLQNIFFILKWALSAVVDGWGTFSFFSLTHDDFLCEYTR